jgi:hypothetical protein
MSTTKTLSEAGVCRIVMLNPNVHEGVVQHGRLDGVVYVPRWWAGKRVRVTLLEGGEGQAKKGVQA